VRIALYGNPKRSEKRGKGKRKGKGREGVAYAFAEAP